MKNIILSISLVLFSISMQAQKRFTLTFTDSIVNIVEQAGAEESLILNLDSYYFIKRTPSNYYFVSGNYSKMLPYNQIDSVVFASTPWVITSDSALNDTIIGYLASVHSGTGNSTDTTSLSNRINLKLNASDTTNYLGLNRASNTYSGTIGFRFISAPSGVANTTSLFADATGRLAWRNGTGYLRTFDATGITADRVYSLPDASTTIAGLAVANTFTQNQAISAPTLTGSSATSAFTTTQTLNTTGSPDIWYQDITNTASGSLTNLIHSRVGGVTMFSLSKAGSIVVAGGITSTATIQQSSTSDFRWNNRSRMFSDANGNIRFSNSALTDFGLLQFGGTTSSFPAIKRSTTTLQVRLADDSGFAFIESLYERAGSGSPEGVVTAPVGAIYHRTDGGAGTSNYFKESGSGSTGWIAK